MKKKNLVLNIFKAYALTSLIALSGFAAETMTVKINGMVCDFCAQGIEKNLKKNPTVEKVSVSLEAKQVTIVGKEGSKLQESDMRTILEKAGYSVVGIDRS